MHTYLRALAQQYIPDSRCNLDRQTMQEEAHEPFRGQHDHIAMNPVKVRSESRELSVNKFLQNTLLDMTTAQVALIRLRVHLGIDRGNKRPEHFLLFLLFHDDEEEADEKVEALTVANTCVVDREGKQDTTQRVDARFCLEIRVFWVCPVHIAFNLVRACRSPRAILVPFQDAVVVAGIRCLPQLLRATNDVPYPTPKVEWYATAYHLFQLALWLHTQGIVIEPLPI